MTPKEVPQNFLGESDTSCGGSNPPPRQIQPCLFISYRSHMPSNQPAFEVSSLSSSAKTINIRPQCLRIQVIHGTEYRRWFVLLVKLRQLNELTSCASLLCRSIWRIFSFCLLSELTVCPTLNVVSPWSVLRSSNTMLSPCCLICSTCFFSSITCSQHTHKHIKLCLLSISQSVLMYVIFLHIHNNF